MIDLMEYGYSKQANTDEGTVARITAVHKERYEIVSPCGISYARLKSSIYFNGSESSKPDDIVFPTTGDFVLIRYNETGDSMIIKTLERKTMFSRRDPTPGRGEQAVAANFDYVFILMSLNHDFNKNRLERYLTAAWQSGGTPVVLLTKADLVDDFSDLLLLTGNVALGVDVYAISAISGYGLNTLKDYLQPSKTIVFLGSSGVGKSSLLNALAGDDVMKINAVREDDAKGRHTTTHRQLVKLNSGVIIIDTPGMRELGMWDVTDGLSASFGDVEDHLGKCHYHDCKHGNEPGCAIQEAIALGTLTAERWQHYLKLEREAKHSEWKAAHKLTQQQRQTNYNKNIRNTKLVTSFEYD